MRIERASIAKGVDLNIARSLGLMYVGWLTGWMAMVKFDDGASQPLVSFCEMESNSKHVCFSVVFTQHLIPFLLFT